MQESQTSRYTRNPAVSFGMHRFRRIRTATVAAAALVLTCTALTGYCRSRKYPRDLTVPVPQFSITVTLSQHARERLQSIHESVLVIAYFDGDPLPGQGQDNAQGKRI